MLDNAGNNTLLCRPAQFNLATGGGTENFTGDYSVTAADAQIAPSAGQIMTISSLQIIIAWNDGGAAAVNWEKFGNLVALSTGLAISATINGFSNSLNGTQAITRNAQMPNLTFTEDHHHSMMIQSVWEFPCPISLIGSAGDFINVNVSDNMTGLSTLRFNALGTYSLQLV